MPTGRLAKARAGIMKSSFEDSKAAILRARSRLLAKSVTTRKVFVSNHVAAEENHHQIEHVFSILIVMETNHKQLQI